MNSGRLARQAFRIPVAGKAVAGIMRKRIERDVAVGRVTVAAVVLEEVVRNDIAERLVVAKRVLRGRRDQILAAPAVGHRRWPFLIGKVDDSEAPGAVTDDPVAEVHACIGEVGRLPALTPAGLLVKARIVRDEVTVGLTMRADEVARTLVADLERLAGEAAA